MRGEQPDESRAKGAIGDSTRRPTRRFQTAVRRLLPRVVVAGTLKGFPNPPAMGAGQQSWPLLPRVVAVEVHRVVGAALRRAAQVGRVAEHAAQRDLRLDD